MSSVQVVAHTLAVRQGLIGSKFIMCETCGGHDWVAPRRTKSNEIYVDIEEDIARLRQRTEEETKPKKKMNRWKFF